MASNKEVVAPVEQEQASNSVEEKLHIPYKTDIISKHFPKFESALPSAEGKNIVITGTTSGTGLVAARTALKKGANVALLNRNEQKARKALAEFFEASPEAAGRAHFVVCDLQDFTSVKQAGEQVAELFSEGVDVIANNAGVMALEDRSTKDGYDVQIQTNHLSHFMLTRDLFPLLVKTSKEKGEARVVNHSSSARLFPMTPLKAKYYKKDKEGKRGGSGKSVLFGGRWQRYHQTKLANSVFTVELQKRCNKANNNILSLCCHPGMAATNLQATTVKEGGLKSTGFMSGAQSQEDGTMGLLLTMLGEKVKKGALYGPFFTTGKATKRNHGFLTSSTAGKILWRESESACGPFDVSAAVI